MAHPHMLNLVGLNSSKSGMEKEARRFLEAVHDLVYCRQSSWLEDVSPVGRVTPNMDNVEGVDIMKCVQSSKGVMESLLNTVLVGLLFVPILVMKPPLRTRWPEEVGEGGLGEEFGEEEQCSVVLYMGGVGKGETRTA